MSYSVVVTSYFKRRSKRLIKKYPSLKNELDELIDNLIKEPHIVTDLGNDCFKIRLSIASKSKGKSGGGRVITHIQIKKTSVYLLTIYDKSEQKDMSDAELSWILKNQVE